MKSPAARGAFFAIIFEGNSGWLDGIRSQDGLHRLEHNSNKSTVREC